MSSPGICIVGCGAIAEIHVEILRSLGASVDHVVGRTEESAASFAKRLGIPASSANLESALDDLAIQAVVVASPNRVHFQQAMTAMEQGRDVLVEIPVALSYDEAEMLVDFAERHGRLLMPAHSERFIPNLVTLKRRIGRGELELVHIVGRETALRRQNVGWTGRERSWTDDLLWHFGGHAVDLALWLADAQVVELHAQASQLDPETNAVMDIDLMLKTDREQLIAINLSFNCHFDQHEYLLIGRDASFKFAGGRLIDSFGMVDDPAERGDDYYHLSWRAQDEEFLGAIHERRQPSLSVRDVLPAMRVLQEVANQFRVAEGVSR
ncbi:MAG: Gfo/Idh/MocA family oxidoreductase [Thermomicrobiales bacterium]|nr:Gfo/Idh/MocA family oxidoreductase [Thermomicrobiales bacterium]MCO5222906.1 Gfo/Idh/MocA family oxidoreductase [Thermomicrobiales bacterium]